MAHKANIRFNGRNPTVLIRAFPTVAATIPEQPAPSIESQSHRTDQGLSDGMYNAHKAASEWQGRNPTVLIRAFPT